MRISAIDSNVYTQKIQNKNTYATKPIACDTFTKSPNFKAANKELQYINDYIAGKSFDIDKINVGLTSRYLPDLKIVENFKDKAIEVLNKMMGISPSRLFDINKANNYQLLKILVEDMNWKLFTDYSLNDMFSAVTSLQNDGREKIKKVLSNENICNLIKQYNREIVIESLIQTPKLGVSYYYILPEVDREEFGNLFAYKVRQKLGDKPQIANEILSEIPTTNYERDQIATFKEYDILYKRLEKVIERNGFETPQELLGCVSDRIMSTELLELNEEALIDKIAKIPVTEENKPIISQIIEKLNGFFGIPDNEKFRNAALVAARQGNAELLKFFDSKGVHYLNNLYEPLSKFPKEVRETLAGAKYNDCEMIDNLFSLKELRAYLTNHPKSDINSKSAYAKSLISSAMTKGRMDILEFLASRDDVNWNITDNENNNVLMQCLIAFNYNPQYQLKFIKFLRTLPEGKFDINYVNRYPGCRLDNEPRTALSYYVKHYNGMIEILDELLKFPGIDTNLNPANGKPLAYLAGRAETFKRIIEHPNTCKEGLYTDDFKEHLQQIWMPEMDKEAITNLLEKNLDLSFLEKNKEIYEREGMFTLKQISDIVNYPNFAKIKDEKYNIIGENIGHFLAETFIDENNQEEFRMLNQIFKRLEECSYDFNSTDDFGITPLEKAKDCQNKVIEYSLRRYL